MSSGEARMWTPVDSQRPSWLETCPAGPGARLIRWEPADSEDVSELASVIEGLLAGPEVQRLVHLTAEGNFADLRVARKLGFIAEGIERISDGTQVRVWWRSARLANPAKDSPALPIDGSRPAHLVAEFHEVYDLPNLVDHNFEPTVDFDRIHMRMSLIKEEFAELCGAVYGPAAEAALLQVYEELPDEKLRDAVEAADALGDLTYVVYGMALEAGIDLDQVIAEVHRSNLSKLMPDGSVRRRGDGKVLKGPNFSEPDIAGSMRRRASR